MFKNISLIFFRATLKLKLLLPALLFPVIMMGQSQQATDDERSIRLIIETTLKSRNEVVTKNDGQEAYYWLTKERNMPDLIICDIEMPNMRGHEFLEIIRNSGFFGDITVIMLSGVEESKERIRCYELKAQDFLTKPFDLKEAGAKIKNKIASNKFF